MITDIMNEDSRNSKLLNFMQYTTKFCISTAIFGTKLINWRYKDTKLNDAIDLFFENYEKSMKIPMILIEENFQNLIKVKEYYNLLGQTNLSKEGKLELWNELLIECFLSFALCPIFYSTFTSLAVTQICIIEYFLRKCLSDSINNIFKEYIGYNNHSKSTNILSSFHILINEATNYSEIQMLNYSLIYSHLAKTFMNESPTLINMARLEIKRYLSSIHINSASNLSLNSIHQHLTNIINILEHSQELQSCIISTLCCSLGLESLLNDKDIGLISENELNTSKNILQRFINNNINYNRSSLDQIELDIIMRLFHELGSGELLKVIAVHNKLLLSQHWSLALNINFINIQENDLSNFILNFIKDSKTFNKETNTIIAIQVIPHFIELIGRQHEGVLTKIPELTKVFSKTMVNQCKFHL